MTPIDAVITIKNFLSCVNESPCTASCNKCGYAYDLPSFYDALELAIEALNAHCDYCYLNKLHTPDKVISTAYTSYHEYYDEVSTETRFVYKCPMCGGEHLIHNNGYYCSKFCPDCGQAIDWSDI